MAFRSYKILFNNYEESDIGRSKLHKIS